MNQFRVRAAVSPLRRDVSAAPSVLPTVDDLIATLRPSEPVHCLRPTVMTAAAREFVADFPGDVLYAVKCNPEPAVLRALWAGGVRHFDCASAREVALVRSMFADAEIHFMHPAKSRAAIRAAYAQHGVRDFVLDSADELAKIVDETDGAADLGLLVRLAMPSGEAVLDLSGKFGAFEDDAALLLRAARMRAARVGVSFHVGSQCMDPLAYRRAVGFRCAIRTSIRRRWGRSSPKSRRGSRRLGCRARGSGRSLGGRWWRPADRWWCRCNCARATCCMSMMASMAACPMRGSWGFSFPPVRLGAITR